MANRFKGDVDVPELGEGVTLRCDMEAVGQIETALGAFEFQQKVLFGLPLCVPSIMRLFLDHATWKDGKRTKTEWPVDAPLETLAQYCLDAFTLCMRGKPHAEWVAEQEAKKTVTENPTKGTAA
jgi:hypothetical protein